MQSSQGLQVTLSDSTKVNKQIVQVALADMTECGTGSGVSRVNTYSSRRDTACCKVFSWISVILLLAINLEK